jgi:hypothetical protein
MPSTGWTENHEENSFGRDNLDGTLAAYPEQLAFIARYTCGWMPGSDDLSQDN